MTRGNVKTFKMNHSTTISSKSTKHDMEVKFKKMIWKLKLCFVYACMLNLEFNHRNFKISIVVNHRNQHIYKHQKYKILSQKNEYKIHSETM